MSEILVKPRFACAGCGKSYKWKPELSRKRVQCKCGTKMQVPDLTPPGDDAPPALFDDDIFALIESAPTGTPQAAKLAVAAPMTAPANPKGKAAVAKLATPGKAPVLPYRGPARGGPPERVRRGSFEEMYDLKRDVYAPTALIAASFCAYFAWLMVHGTAASGATLAAYGTYMFALFAIKTVLMIGGAFIVAPMAGVSFGPIWTAILKLAAVTIAPDVFTTILGEAMGFQGASFIAGIVGLACYWGLMSWLFQFEAAEAWHVVVLFGALRWFLTMILSIALMSLFLSGTSLSGGFGGSAGSAATVEAIHFDETVADLQDRNCVEEGLAYVERTGRQSGKVATIKRIYDAGARDVSFTLEKDINGKGEPLSLAVQWPRDAKKRAAVLAAINDSIKIEAEARAKMHPEWPKPTPDLVSDEGGKYVEVPIGH